jgi:GNAT superfamily N-acetyltransferase
MDELGFEIAPGLTHVREYRDEDAAEVARIWRESSVAWPGTGPGGGEIASEAIARMGMVEWNTLAFFLAWAPDRTTGQERVVGYCWLTPYRNDADVGYVHILGVHQDYHGGGFGRDLLKAALAKSVALGHRQLTLHTWPGNARAIPLYQRSGYFWEPDSSVHMHNYLPTIFRLDPARRLFAGGLDWYADFKRVQLGALEPDAETYEYLWERDGRRLRVAIDRRAHAVSAIETDDLEVSARVDDGPAAVGGERVVVLRVASRVPSTIALVAEGRDGVTARLSESATVEGTREWRIPAHVERAGDGRVDATAILARPDAAVRDRRGDAAAQTDGPRRASGLHADTFRLAVTVRGLEPVEITFDRQRWLRPGLAQTYWVTLTNALEEPVAGTLRVAGSPGLTIDRDQLAFELGPRERTGLRLCVVATASGSYTLRARVDTAASDRPSGREWVGHLHCGDAGALLVEQTAEAISVATDHTIVEAPLPGSPWGAGINLIDRASGRQVMDHGCMLGLPFFPAGATTSGFSGRVEREDGAATLVLTALAPKPPGVSLEWLVRVAASGVVKLTYRVANLGTEPRPLKVGSATHVNLPGDSVRTASPLASGLVDEPAIMFPDWFDPAHTRPERHAEGWMARYGDGLVAATLWEQASEVVGWYGMPALELDLGTLAPGARAEAPPVYLYVGPGDWRTARRLWRSLVAPDAPVEDPVPRPAHVARLERFVGTDDALDTRIVLTSERARQRTGQVTLEVHGEAVGAGDVDALRIGEPRAVSLRAPLPACAGAQAATICFEHALGTDEYPAALIRAGDGRVSPTVRAERLDGLEVVRIENGAMGLVVVPGQVGRVAELTVAGVNQLHASWPEAGNLGQEGSWFGGVHPLLTPDGYKGWAHTGPLRDARFDWQEVERTGGQGVRWKGVGLTTEPTAPELRGLRLSIDYLVAGGGNLLAIATRLENHGRAPWRGRLELVSFLAPGGDRDSAELRYLHGGREHGRRRIHGESTISSGRWSAVAAPGGTALALVAASPGAEVWVWEAGLAGAHPYVVRPVALDPGASVETVGYLAVADGLEQARLYQYLSEGGGLA